MLIYMYHVSARGVEERMIKCTLLLLFFSVGFLLLLLCKIPCFSCSRDLFWPAWWCWSNACTWWRLSPHRPDCPSSRPHETWCQLTSPSCEHTHYIHTVTHAVIHTVTHAVIHTMTHAVVHTVTHAVIHTVTHAVIVVRWKQYKWLTCGCISGGV